MNKFDEFVNAFSLKVFEKNKKLFDKYYKNKITKECILKIIKKLIIYTTIFILACIIISFAFLLNKKHTDEYVSEFEINEFINNDKYVDLDARLKDETVRLNVKVPKKNGTDEEIVDRILKSLDSNLIKGDNSSLFNVTTNLNLITKNKYNALIDYKSKMGYININDGSVIRPYKGENDYKDTLIITVSYNDIKKVKEIKITIKESTYTKEEFALKNAIEEIKNKNQNDELFNVINTNKAKLIDNINGVKVDWLLHKDIKENDYSIYAVLFIIYILFIVNVLTKDFKNEKKQTLKLESQFVEFLEDYYLLYIANFNLANAIKYIQERYGKDNLLKENLNIMSNEIDLGKNVYSVLEDFSKRSKSIRIEKCITKIVLNLKRGNPNFDFFLKNEISEMTENKKLMARKIAEENNIKALLPLMMILISTMLLVVYPAIVQMNF